MADGWISGLLRQLFWCTLILDQWSKGVSEWDGGEGWEVAQKFLTSGFSRIGKATKNSQKGPSYTISQDHGGV